MVASRKAYFGLDLLDLNGRHHVSVGKFPIRWRRRRGEGTLSTVVAMIAELRNCGFYLFGKQSVFEIYTIYIEGPGSR